MTEKTGSLAATVLGVKRIPPNQLYPNPYNPRALFDDQPLNTLRESIKRHGILVPLTIYHEAKSQHYVILDGQRRWMCAQDLKLRTVPVNQVAEPTLVQNVVTMFQIHKTRADWELMPTALKVELLMKETQDRNNARLAQLTGLDETMIVRCKKLISYPREFQDMMLDPNPEKRIKADFFVELYSVIRDRDVENFHWFKRNEFIRQMLSKYLNDPRTIRAVTDFRLVKQYITNARRIGGLDEFSKRLKQFASAHETQLSHLEMQEASIHAEAKSVTARAEALQQLLNELDVQKFYGEEELWNSLTRLIETLTSKLKEADKRR